jgi:hypothetical protein
MQVACPEGLRNSTHASSLVDGVQSGCSSLKRAHADFLLQAKRVQKGCDRVPEVLVLLCGVQVRKTSGIWNRRCNFVVDALHVGGGALVALVALVAQAMPRKRSSN